jgi:hypothetical protein
MFCNIANVISNIIFLSPWPCHKRTHRIDDYLDIFNIQIFGCSCSLIVRSSELGSKNGKALSGLRTRSIG